MGLHSGSMIDGMIHLKLFSLLDGNSSTQSTLLLVFGYCLFIVFKKYNEDIRYFFRKYNNEKVLAEKLNLYIYLYQNLKKENINKYYLTILKDRINKDRISKYIIWPIIKPLWKIFFFSICSIRYCIV